MRTLFDAERSALDDAIAYTAASLSEYGARYRHWAVAYSGGKDSSAVATLVPSLISAGRVPRPASLTVLYADTRQELPPLRISADGVMQCLRLKGIDARVVLPALDDRYFVYMLGRGVPPPTNRFRWCTDSLKVAPMNAALRDLRERFGKLLMLTGVRSGESAARDGRIALSCSKDGGECGQGWFQHATPASVADTLAPVLHWRVCHVWEWLTRHAPAAGFPTAPLIADAYGGSTDAERLADVNARTGCIGCPLASRETALDRVLRLPHWAYLAPLKRLKPLYAELRLHHHRLRKANDERRADGSVVSNPGRVGPLKLGSRRYGLGVVLGVQAEVNAAAAALGRPSVDLIDGVERARIEALIAANTWPDRWDGTELPGETDVPRLYPDGSVQHSLFGD